MSPNELLDEFIDRYTPQVAAHARSILATMRLLLPGAFEVVYDNYNALVVGFGATVNASEFILSVALYPRYVTLFFAAGASLNDPTNRLAGAGKNVRSIRVDRLELLDEPDVRALIDEAVARSSTPLDRTAPNRLIIRAASAKRRPRRPGKRYA
jgi:hypothetical protein